jgi:hypothetical protein
LAPTAKLQEAQPVLPARQIEIDLLFSSTGPSPCTIKKHILVLPPGKEEYKMVMTQTEGFSLIHVL